MDEKTYVLAYSGEDIDAAMNQVEDTGDHVQVCLVSAPNAWNYKKYASGDAILWGRFTVTPSESNASSGMYYSNTISIPTPFGVANASVVGSCENLCSVVNAGNSFASKTVSFRIRRPVAIDTNTPLTVQLQVFGVWRP